MASMFFGGALARETFGLLGLLGAPKNVFFGLFGVFGDPHFRSNYMLNIKVSLPGPSKGCFLETFKYTKTTKRHPNRRVFLCSSSFSWPKTPW